MRARVAVVPVGAQHHLVAPAPGLPGPAEHGVQRQLFVVVVIGATHQAGTQARGAVHRARDIGVLERAGLAVGDRRQLELPVGIDGMAEVGEDLGGLEVPVRPGRAQEGAACQPQVAAVGVARHAHHGRHPVARLVAGAQGDGGGRSQVGLDDAVQRIAPAAGIAHMGVALVVRGRQAGTHRPIGVQRGAVVDLGTGRIPGAQAQRAREAPVARGTLAHQIDHAAGLARAIEQARSAAQRLHMVEHHHVRLAPGSAACLHGKAVVLEVLDGIAARIEGRNDARARQVHGHAGGLRHDLVQRVQILVLDLLARDDGDRMRRLPERGRQLGSHRDARGRVATRQLGGPVLDRLARDLHLGQPFLGRPGQGALAQDADGQRDRCDGKTGRAGIPVRRIWQRHSTLSKQMKINCIRL